jgi:polyisoprenoid-binding protein YceI
MTLRIAGLVAALALVVAVPGFAADNYSLDASHSGIRFSISHIGLSQTYGRFNEISGKFTIDTADAGKSAFEVSIPIESIDTGNKQRDEHLRSPDFFNAKQFPTLTFKSTKVAKAKDGLEVTGDLSLHGVTKPVTFTLTGGKTAEFPKGTPRTGYTTKFMIKRSDYGMDKSLPAVGDEVEIEVSFEGVKK